MAAYDGIVIGAGHHGLILGTYLARAGLRIAVVERRLLYGGGLATSQPGLPGFYHNFHSINHYNITKAPWFEDLGLKARVEYVEPRYEFAQPHQDGTALVFSRDIDETVESISRFSRRDAETFRDWHHRAAPVADAIFLPERYSEPIPEAERDELLSRSQIGRDFLEIVNRQPRDVVLDLFEDERVQLLLLFKISLFGTVLYDQVATRSPMGAFVRAFDLKSGYEVCRGGSFNLAVGLMEAFIRAGGTFINQAEVDRIVVQQARAVGVELRDGQSLSARQFVASTVDVPQTFQRMVGFDQLPSSYQDRVMSFRHTGWSLFGLHLSLSEPPRYASATFDPNIDRALKYNIGCESLEDLFDLHREVADGRVPSRLSFGTGAISVLDPTQAPPGRATAYAWLATPFAPGGDPRNIEPLKEGIADKIVEKWSEYVPNLADTVLSRHIHTANDYSRDLINMVNGDIFMGSFAGDQTMWNHFGYRTPIAGLYMAGSPTHPGGAISGGGSYIAAGLIADDLGIRKWWEPIDARRSIGSLAEPRLPA